MGVYTVYIRYIHLIQLIQMDRCSVVPPHRDFFQLSIIFQKIFLKIFLQTPLKTLDKSSTLCYNISTNNGEADEAQRITQHDAQARLNTQRPLQYIGVKFQAQPLG